MIGCSDVLVKICGITRQEDADCCLEHGVSLLGFIFHPDSPRCVTPRQAAAIDTGSAMRVGVFVNQHYRDIQEIMYDADLNLAQLHGDQDKDFCVHLGKAKIMRTFWPERYPDRKSLEADLARYESCCRFFLLDAGSSGGGHGRPLDFSRIHGLKPQKTWFLAGGLGPHNIMQALAACDPCGVDLNSGVELMPGVKDHDKIKEVNRLLCVKRHF